MNFKQKLQQCFPNLTIYTFEKHRIFFGKEIVAYITYVLTNINKPNLWINIYKCRTFYIVD